MNYLGQHFLKNDEAIKKIVAALDLHEGEAVVEIGPGRGALTSELLKQPIELIAVEKDHQFVKDIEYRIQNLEFSNRIKIIEGDILKVLPILHSKSYILNSKYKLVGNIPYYLTGFLFRTISELENKPDLIVFTIQKDVAERIIAQPPKMNLLAASIQIWAEPEILMLLSPEDFDPPPAVNSAIIKLRLTDYELIRNSQFAIEKYYKLIKVIFKQPRKTLLNNLSTSDVNRLNKEELKKELQKLGLTGEERGQDLNIEKLKELSHSFPHNS